MKNKLLIGVAALAMVAGTGIASSQQPQQGGSQQQQHEGKNNSPAPRSSQENTAKEPEGRAHDATPKQTQSAPAGDKKTAEGQDSEKKAQQGSQQNQRQGQQDRNGANQRQTQDRDGDKKRDGQAQTESKPAGGKDAKTELNSEQRTKISQSVNKSSLKRVDRSRINFNISIGTVVPRTYTFYPVPAPVIAVVPAYRGFLYIVVGDEMLIIHPRTHEIVAVIAV
jgi:hypothetical protein